MKTEEILEREIELHVMREALAAYVVDFEFDRIAPEEAPSTLTAGAPLLPRNDGPTDTA